jgi:hypothetical protein
MRSVKPTFTIKLRSDNAADWATNNPVLKKGEPGFEEDTGKFKIGDGLHRWKDLLYFVGGIDSADDLYASQIEFEAHINSETPHPAYDEGPSLLLLYANAKV